MKNIKRCHAFARGFISIAELLKNISDYVNRCNVAIRKKCGTLSRLLFVVPG